MNPPAMQRVACLIAQLATSISRACPEEGDLVLPRERIHGAERKERSSTEEFFLF
jgi:hypothetical protein